MTGDDTERRKQFLKQQLRTQRDARRLGEKLRPSTPEAIDQRWKDQQLRWEAEDELDREEEAAAVKRRQQELRQEPANPPTPEQQPTTADPPPLSVLEPELSEASDAETGNAIKDVYDSFGKGKGPNVNEVIEPVQNLLKERGFKKSGRRIRELAGGKQYTEYRRPPGSHQ